MDAKQNGISHGAFNASISAGSIQLSPRAASEQPSFNSESTSNSSAVASCDSLSKQLPQNRKYVAVRLLSDEMLFFNVDVKRATVASLKSILCAILAINDLDLFGLGQFPPACRDNASWLDFRLILDEDLKLGKLYAKVWKAADSNGLESNGCAAALLHLSVRVYVDYSSVIRCDNSLYYYYLTLRQNLLNYWQCYGSLPNKELMLEIAAFALQADFGDRALLKGRTRYFAPSKYLPQWMITLLGSECSVRYLTDLHSALSAMPRSQAMRMFCDKASPQSLAQYRNCTSLAEHLFLVRASKGDKSDNAAIGVACRGVAVYKIGVQPEKKGEPSLTSFELVASYDWPEIAKLAYDKRRFLLIGLDGVRRSFYSCGADANKTRYMLDLCKVVHSKVMKLYDQLQMARVQTDGALRGTFRESYIWSDESDRPPVVTSRQSNHLNLAQLQQQQQIVNLSAVHGEIYGERRYSLAAHSDSTSTSPATTSGIVSDSSRPALPNANCSHVDQTGCDWECGVSQPRAAAQKTCSVTNLYSRTQPSINYEHNPTVPSSSVSSWSLWQWRKISDTGTLLQPNDPSEGPSSGTHSQLQLNPGVQPHQHGQVHQSSQLATGQCADRSAEVVQRQVDGRPQHSHQKRWPTLTDGLDVQAAGVRNLSNVAHGAGLSQSTNEITTLLEQIDDQSRADMLAQLRAARDRQIGAMAPGAVAQFERQPQSPLYEGQNFDHQMSGVYSKNARAATSKTKLNLACARAAAAAMHNSQQHVDANAHASASNHPPPPVFSIKRAQSAYGPSDLAHCQLQQFHQQQLQHQDAQPTVQAPLPARRPPPPRYVAAPPPNYQNMDSAGPSSNLAVYAVPHSDKVAVSAARSECNLSSAKVPPSAPSSGSRQPPSYEEAVASLRTRSASLQCASGVALVDGLQSEHGAGFGAAGKGGRIVKRCSAIETSGPNSMWAPDQPGTSGGTECTPSASCDDNLGGSLRAAVAQVRAHGRRKLPFLHALLRDSANDLQYVENADNSSVPGASDASYLQRVSDSGEPQAMNIPFAASESDLQSHRVNDFVSAPMAARQPPPYAPALHSDRRVADASERCVSVPDLALYAMCGVQDSLGMAAPGAIESAQAKHLAGPDASCSRLQPAKCIVR